MTETVVARVRSMPVERVEARIVELSSQLSGAMCELLVLVGEFDDAEGWRSWGLRSTAQWLSWKCGVGLVAGREQVRVARAIRRFPQLLEPFSQGRLSYSKVRAITRVATEETVAILVDWAELETARAQLPEPSVEVRTAEENSMRACEECRNASAKASCPDVSETAKEQRRPARSMADALVWMAEQTVRHAEHQVEEATGQPGLDTDRFQLVLHASAEASLPIDAADDDAAEGITLESGQRLHPATGRRLTCGCPYAVQTDDAEGNPLHLGRKTRRIRGRLARAVHHRTAGTVGSPVAATGPHRSTTCVTGPMAARRASAT